jgi:GH24 family phage-related lysozyme (muramidase)
MSDGGIGQVGAANPAAPPEPTEHTNPAWAQAVAEAHAASPPPNANAGMHISAAGLAALRASEGQVNGGAYYNDQAGNCTRGTGILVHQGACSAAELARPTDAQANENDFQSRVNQAEEEVRQRVPDRQLTQPQFDALVSATYNLGNAGVRPVLNDADRNNDPGVVQELRNHVMVHQTDAHGHRTMVRSHGLENRREREAAPFGGAPH